MCSSHHWLISVLNAAISWSILSVAKPGVEEVDVSVLLLDDSVLGLVIFVVLPRNSNPLTGSADAVEGSLPPLIIL